MDLKRTAEISNIVSASGTLYCGAIATWSLFHPSGLPAVHDGQGPSLVSHLNLLQGSAVVVFVIVVFGVVFASILNYRILHKSDPPHIPPIQETKTIQQSPALQATSHPIARQKNLTFRLIDAVAGVSPEPNLMSSSPNIEICLHLRLINQADPPMIIRFWKLELLDSNLSFLATAYKQILRTDMTFTKITLGLVGDRRTERFDKDLGEMASSIPMDELVPFDGWLRFTLSGILLHHVFGATFALTAVDANDKDYPWTYTIPPGTWLKPAEFSIENRT